jgi:hypothetical protein
VAALAAVVLVLVARVPGLTGRDTPAAARS